VVKLDPATRRVVVGPEEALGKGRIALRDVNWLGDRPLSDEGMAVAVKIRSAHGPVPATLFGKPDGGAEVVFDTPERAVAPGQACVFYAGTRVLGGGFIRREG
jgi:tRNA-specific 2-thiouridylase